MKTLYGVILIIIGACAPIQEKNTPKEGFITKDIYQTTCSWNMTEKVRANQLVIQCRRKTVTEWASLKKAFDSGTFRTADEFSMERLKKVKDLKPKKVHYSSLEVEFLLTFYDDLLPGFLIYERREANEWSGIYRVHKENLMGLVLQRDPFQSRKKETLGITIFK